MNEVHEFGTIVLLVAAGFALAVATSRLSERFSIPGPAIFLIAAAVLSDLSDSIGDALTVKEVERIGVVALIVILFDGGARIGLERMRVAGVPVISLGVVGTFATAGLVTVAAHVLLDFSWITAGLIGAAIAPTDPAVMFSVLGKREVSGRTGTILEGESGVNDPVGIALMIGMIEMATNDEAGFSTVIWEFVVEMVVGLAVGVAGAYALVLLMRHVTLPSAGLYPIRTLAAAGVIYGLASVAHGSGFLAVFVAGLIVGDIRAPYQQDVERFMTSLSSVAEIAVFVALGLTIDLASFDQSWWLNGIVLAVLLALLIRPVVVAVLLVPARLRLGERLFVMWGGLKGAVPIFLAAFALLAAVEDADEIYAIVFVVVALSVLVQGTTIPLAASILNVPMRVIEQEPPERA
jgi:potassium/hydrogen antiporter